MPYIISSPSQNASRIFLEKNGKVKESKENVGETESKAI
jgi:hypothetical protein